MNMYVLLCISIQEEASAYNVMKNKPIIVIIIKYSALFKFYVIRHLDSKISLCSDYLSFQASEEIEIKKHAITN